jgi:two-component system sensor histidine kinase/response regulator
MAALLIVDDDAALRDVLYELFSGEHLCHTAGTAEQALTYLESETYDLAIIDISLPGMSGLELLTQVRLRHPATSAIVISGIDYQQHTGDLIRLGAFDYLIKPFQLEEIEESVGCALARRAQKEEARAVERQQQTGDAGRRPWQGKPSILIVDDAPDIAEMLATLLRNEGYHAVVATSAAGTLAVAAPERFDTVIVDIAMPFMTGYDLVERLRELPHYRDVPIISVTGFSMYDDRLRALAAGFDAHLTKPIDPGALLNTIATLRVGAGQGT